jgi:hypothetical protein
VISVIMCCSRRRRCEHFRMTASAPHFIGTKQEGKFVSGKYVSGSVF